MRHTKEPRPAWTHTTLMGLDSDHVLRCGGLQPKRSNDLDGPDRYGERNSDAILGNKFMRSGSTWNKTMEQKYSTVQGRSPVGKEAPESGN